MPELKESSATSTNANEDEDAQEECNEHAKTNESKKYENVVTDVSYDTKNTDDDTNYVDNTKCDDSITPDIYKNSSKENVKDKTRVDQEANTDPKVPDQEDDDDDKEGLPIDRGWAWIILLASALCFFILIGYIKIFGIVFVQLQERFQSSAAQTSLIFTLQNISYSLTGCSNAFIQPQVTTMISVYFERKRGFANNIANAGVSLGGLVLAPIFTILFKEYAFTGTCMFITGLHFNMLVVACLIRPMSFYKKRRKKMPEEEVKLLRKEFNTVDGGDTKTTETDISSAPFTEPNILFKGDFSQLDHSNGNMALNVRRRTVSESGCDFPGTDPSRRSNSFLNSNMARFASTDIVNSSLYDLTLIQYDSDMQLKETINTLEKRQKKVTTIRKAIIRLGSKALDLKLLSKPVFLYFLVCNLFLTAGNVLITSFLPPHAFEMGVDKERIALIVSGTSVLDFISRFVFAPLSDNTWCRRSTLIGITAVISGVTAQFVHFMTSFGTICILAAVGGFLQGVYWSLFVVVILDILTFQDFKGAYGFVCLVQGAGASLSLLCSGYLRDYTGQYFLTYNFIGVCLIVGGILIYLLPYVNDWSQRRDSCSNKEKQETSAV